MSDTQERHVSQLVDDCRYVARELEVYGAEEPPQVNVHKQLFRLAAALIRRNASALQASEEREQRQASELRRMGRIEERLRAAEGREQRLRTLCDDWVHLYDLQAAIDALERCNDEESEMAADAVDKAAFVLETRAIIDGAKPSE